MIIDKDIIINEALNNIISHCNRIPKDKKILKLILENLFLLGQIYQTQKLTEDLTK